MSKKLLFSVTLDDCEVQTFRAGGKGGQHQNKTSSGVRIIHNDSGARGEARDERSQLQNKKMAFKRMVESDKFQSWLRLKSASTETEEQYLARQMSSENIRVEGRGEGGWKAIG